MASFLTNSPNKFQGGIASTLSPRNLRQTLFGAYLQDDWRWKSNLTLNLGLRYEMSTVIRETAGKLANLVNLSDADPHLGNPFFHNPTLRNFEPRVGFATHFNGDCFEVGLMFDVQPMPHQFVLLTTQAAFLRVMAVNNPGDFERFAGLTDFLANTRSTYIQHPAELRMGNPAAVDPRLAAMIAYVVRRRPSTLQGG